MSERTLVQSPPQGCLAKLRHLGPGLVVSASVVGSGELVATTKTGAATGSKLLWLIILGCLLKLFVQIEFGRFAISSGTGAVKQLDLIPGPRLRFGWAVWLWILLLLAAIGQLGGILHGVGQCLALAFPIYGDYREMLEQGSATLTLDDLVWSGAIALATAFVLATFRYGQIETFSTLLVGCFMGSIVWCLAATASTPNSPLTAGMIIQGLQFSLPDSKGWTLAFATFGIIGMGAMDLMSYPVWCLEKGYAAFVGDRNSAGWLHRAKGWLAIMRIDAAMSAAVYTTATVVFYLLGAALLHPKGLDPDGSHMIPVLAQIYAPLGPHASTIFWFGALATLYSTFYVGTASLARLSYETVKVTLPDLSVDAGRWVRNASVLFPVLAFLLLFAVRQPVLLIVGSGFLQALMLPVLGVAALWSRYRDCEPELLPGRLWDACLWTSVICFGVAGLFAIANMVYSFFG